MPIEAEQAERYCKLRNRLVELSNDIASNLRNLRSAENEKLLGHCEQLLHEFDHFCDDLGVRIQSTDVNLNSASLLLHMVRETQQLLVELTGLIKTEREYHSMVK